MVGPGQLELEFRRTWGLGLTQPYVCACALQWGSEPCHGSTSFCHELESSLALSFSPCGGGKAWRRLTAYDGISMHLCGLLRPRTSKDTKLRFQLCRLLYFLTEFSQWLKALAKALSTCSLSTVLDAINSLSDRWRLRPSLFWSLQTSY